VKSVGNFVKTWLISIFEMKLKFTFTHFKKKTLLKFNLQHKFFNMK
jgi:hypothetical protein